MDYIEEIEVILKNADKQVFDSAASVKYLKVIAKTQVLILKELCRNKE